jgi:hypothetical protein
MSQILLYRMIRLIPRVECVFAALVYFQLSQLYHTSQSCSKGRLQVQEIDTRKKWSAGNVRSLSRPAYQMFTGGSSPVRSSVYALRRLIPIVLFLAMSIGASVGPPLPLGVVRLFVPPPSDVEHWSIGPAAPYPRRRASRSD